MLLLEIHTNIYSQLMNPFAPSRELRRTPTLRTLKFTEVCKWLAI